MADMKEVALFLMAQPATFTWPVEVRIPLQGRYGVATFEGEFHNMTDEDRDALMTSKEDGSPKFSHREVADRVLVSFAKLQQPDGSYLPCTPENKAALLSVPRVALAVVGVFLAVTRGMAAEKNA